MEFAIIKVRNGKKRWGWVGGLVAVLWAVGGGQGQAQMNGSGQPDCAWQVRLGPEHTNAFFPDTSAAYWIMRYEVQPGLKIRLHGTFPESRFASFTVYKDGGGTFVAGDGLASDITDYEMVPAVGSANPWAEAGATPGGAFELLLEANPARQAGVNVLPLAPDDAEAGAGGSLVYRVYVARTGNFDEVPLPRVTLEVEGQEPRVIPACASSVEADESWAHESWVEEYLSDMQKLPPALAAPPVNDVRFFLPYRDDSLGPNEDSGYLLSQLVPPRGEQVLVVRGLAPQQVSGGLPSVWPDAAADMRYWSICSNLALVQRPVVVNVLEDGSVDYGCRYDDEVALDAAGYYTVVVGTEAQRARIEAVHGVTFVPFSNAWPRVPHLVLLRNMLVSEGFEYAVQNVGAPNDPERAARDMGAYYPQATLCELAVLRKLGAEACF